MFNGLEVILSATISILIAQLLKVVFFYTNNHQWNWKLMTSTGGSPSSHSAAVMATMLSVALTSGFDSDLFAVALVFGIIVMYDAAGLRRSAGQTAKQLNMLIDAIYKKRPFKFKKKLQELLGHTPFEVFMGALLGAIISLLIHPMF